MRITTVSYSLSERPQTISEWESGMMSEIKTLIQESNVVIYPELNLVGLSDYFPGELKEQYQQIAKYTLETLLPKLTTILKGSDVLLCLGSGPRIVEKKIYNTAFLWVKDTWVYQDKLHLTPWEVDFTPGSTLQIFEFHGLKTCALICFDIEMPALALYLKRQGIDLILVPSATTDKNGNQRINRCASARSIEVGAAVVTCPIVGDSKYDLIDHSEGRAGFFMPAQKLVVVEQESFSDYSVKEKVIAHFDLEVAMLKELKKRDEETKPYFKEDVILF